MNDSFIEPSHTGISYSFTADGFYEEAYYRAVANRTLALWTVLEESANGDPATKPSCPSSIMQFQHGTFVENADGSLTLTPFSVDGRELISAPCSGSTSAYLRYDQAETMEVCISTSFSE